MIDLPDIRQAKEHDCGPTAVKVLLRYLRKRPTKAQWAGLLNDPVDGTDPRAIETWLRGLGLLVLSGSMTLDDLARLTKTFRPVVCLITPSHGVGHYVTVSGVGSGKVWFQDPTNGPAFVPIPEWKTQWLEVDRLGADYHQWGIAAWRR